MPAGSASNASTVEPSAGPLVLPPLATESVASGVLPAASAFAQPRPTGGLPPRPVSNTRAEAKRLNSGKLSRKADGGVAGNRSKKARRDGALTWEVPPPLDASQELCGHHGTPSSGTEQDSQHHRDDADSAEPAERNSAEPIPSLTPLVLVHRSAFGEVAGRHLAAVVGQLLAAEGVADAGMWAPLVTLLASQAAASLSPRALAARGVYDPRFYIKVKRVAGAAGPEESCLVGGVVARKNVAHRRMRTHIANPRIIMLGSTLGSSNKLSSFDTVLDQEPAQLRSAVEKLASFMPDIVLVERSVARAAQELLLERGIALVLNVKPALLERISRCTGGQIARSIEAVTEQCIASCAEFSVENFNLSQGMTNGTPAGLPLHPAAAGSNLDRMQSSGPMPGLAGSGDSFSTGAAASARSTTSAPRTLMYFKGCPNPVGCTVLLKGPSQAELTAVKRVMQFAAYTAHRLRLETAFLADEFASGTAATYGLQAGASQRQPAAGLGQSAVPDPAAAQGPAQQPSPSPAAANSVVAASIVSTAGDAASVSAEAVEASSVACHSPPAALAPSPSAPVAPASPSLVQPPLGPASPAPAPSAPLPSSASPLALASALGTEASSQRQAVGLTTPPLPQLETAAGAAPAAGPAAEATPLELSQPSPLKQSDAAQRAQQLLDGSTPQSDDIMPWSFCEDTMLAEARAEALESAKQVAEDRPNGYILSCSPHVSVSRVSRADQEADTEASTPGPTASTFAPTPNDAASAQASETTDREAQAAQLLLRLTSGSGAGTSAPGSPSALLASPMRRLTSPQRSGEATAELLTDPLSLAARELMLQRRQSGEGSTSLTSTESASLRDALDSYDAVLRTEDEHSQRSRDKAAEVAEKQRVFVSIACRNPVRGLLCEPPSVQRIDYYLGADVPLSVFLAAAAPQPHKQCPLPSCGDGATSHLRTFLHGNARITLSVTRLPPGQELPGAAEGQLWFWARPLREGPQPVPSARRVLLSPEASCLSFGHFLELSFGAQHLDVHGRPLHNGLVRYFGMGPTVACFHHEVIVPNTVVLPAPQITYHLRPQQAWLQQEIRELAKEAHAAFDAIEFAVQQHATAVMRAIRSMDATPEVLTRLADGLAVERVAFDAELADVVQLVRLQGFPTGAEDSASSGGSKDPAWDQLATLAHQTLVSVVWEVNRMRRWLVQTVVSWAETLREAPLPRSASSRSLAALSSQPEDGAAAFSPSASSPPYLAPVVAAAAADSAGTSPNTPKTGSSPKPPAKLRRSSALFQDAADDQPVLSDAAAPNPDPLSKDSQLQEEPAAPSIMANGNATHAHKDEQQLLPLSAELQTATANAVADMPAQNGLAKPAEGATASHNTANSTATAAAPAAAQRPATAPARVGGADAEAPAGAGGSPGAPSSTMVSPFASAAADSPPDAGRVSRYVALFERSRDGLAGATDEQGRRGYIGLSADHRLLQRRRTLEWLNTSQGGHNTDSSQNEGDKTSAKRTSSQGLGFRPAPYRGRSQSHPQLMIPRFTSRQGSAAIDEGAAEAATTAEAANADAAAGDDEEHDADGEDEGDDDSQSSNSSASYHSGFGGTLEVARSSSSFTVQLGKGYSGPLPAPGMEKGEMEQAFGAEAQQSPKAAIAEGGREMRRSSSAADVRQASPPPAPRSSQDAPTGKASAAIDPRLLRRVNSEPQSPAPSHAGEAVPVEPVSHFEEWAEVLDSVDGDATGAHGGSVAASGTAAGENGTEGTAGGGATDEEGLRDSIRDLLDRKAALMAAKPSDLAVRPGLAGLKLPGRRLGRPEAVAGTIPLSSGKVELAGRPMLPAGADDLVVAVHDDEPTSIVAYFLGTRAHQQYVDDATATILYGAAKAGQGGAGQPSAHPATWSPSHPAPDRPRPDANHLERQLARVGSSSSMAEAGGGISSAPSTAPATPSARDHPAPAAAAAKPPPPPAMRFGGERGEGDSAADWRVLLSEEAFHFQHSVEESTAMPWNHAKFQVVAYYAPQFAELRRRCVWGGRAGYVASLSRCRRWESRGGKSNAYFAKTRDDRFIVKQLSKTEKQSFLEFAPAYFKYVATAINSKQGTCLSKIVGVYQITQKGLGPGVGGDTAKGAGKDGVMDILVTENVFYDRAISRIYDLKGSERSRYNSEDPSDAGAVLLDENLKESNLSAPILVDQQAYARLEAALWADTAFLAGLGVMDYSLLVGLDKDNRHLSLGIIDFVRQYTWDKQLETWVKSRGLLGGAAKEPTIISPKQYMRRFRAAMTSYFTLVPAFDPPAPHLSPDQGIA